MHGLTSLDLARIQFGFTVSFHILLPAITIGLASFLAFLGVRQSDAAADAAVGLSN